MYFCNCTYFLDTQVKHHHCEIDWESHHTHTHTHTHTRTHTHTHTHTLQILIRNRKNNFWTERGREGERERHSVYWDRWYARPKNFRSIFRTVGQGDKEAVTIFTVIILIVICLLITSITKYLTTLRFRALIILI